jgi:hypothetical protein
MKRSAIIATIGAALLWSNLAFSEWWFSVVDYAKTDCGNSITLSSSGIPHIAYTDDDGLSLRFEYVTWNPEDSTWILELAHDVSCDPLLKLDSRQLPHIVSHAGACGCYTYKDTMGIWTVEGHKPWYMTHSFDMDSKDCVHVVSDWVYPYFIDTLLFHWHKDSTGWHEEIVYGILEPYALTGKRKVSMVIDRDDVIHIAYYSGTREKTMYYAKRVDDVWHKELIDPERVHPGEPYRDPSIAIDTCGYPCVSYVGRWVDPYSYKLKFARRTETGWQVEIADIDSSRRLSRTCLCIDPDNQPRIIYRDTDAHIKYAWSDGSSWNVTILDKTGLQPDVDMVIDKDGYSHICYDGDGRQHYAKGHGFLGVAEGSNCQLAMSNGQLSAYPNPFTHNTVVEFMDVETRHVMSLQVHDVTGRLVQQTQSRIIGRNLAPGIYFVKAPGYSPAKMIKTGGVR